MGVTSEHWCSDCKKNLDKAKDQYVEAEFPNQKEPNRSSRVFLCKTCAQKSKVTVGAKKVSVWMLFRGLRNRGNPKFEIGIHCFASSVCATYEPRQGRVNCKNIAATPEGQIYCKRNHPGFVILPQEKDVAERSRFDSIMKYIRRMVGLTGFRDVKSAMRAHGMDPVNAKDVVQLGPVGKNITNA
jgi:hypothetical protein